MKTAKRKPMRSVWIVEMLNDAYWTRRPPRWAPTIGAALDRARAREVRQEWQRKNPDTRFRIRRYVAKEPRP